jgi:AAA15 family ATPase/GTPase
LLYFLNKKSDSRFSYCLEEPEAHLHPCSQIKIADLIACFLNRGNAFQITTHSDYFLQRINQLIKLGDIRRLDEGTFEKLCDERGLLKSSYIDRSKVKAYFFYKNAEGKVEVEDMPLTQDGISYKTFYDITRDLNEREEYINEQLYKLNEK